MSGKAPELWIWETPVNWRVKVREDMSLRTSQQPHCLKEDQTLLLFNLFNFVCVCVPESVEVCVCAHGTQERVAVPLKALPGSSGCRCWNVQVTWYWSWELNLCPLQEPRGLLTSELSVHPYCFSCSSGWSQTFCLCFQSARIFIGVCHSVGQCTLFLWQVYISLFVKFLVLIFFA